MRVCSASTSFAAAAVMIRAWSSDSMGAAIGGWAGASAALTGWPTADAAGTTESI
jgi:hypothetical protein